MVRERRRLDHNNPPRGWLNGNPACCDFRRIRGSIRPFNGWGYEFRAFYQPVVSIDYMAEPLLLPVLEAVTRGHGIALNIADTTFYIGHETMVVRDEATINCIPEAIFSYLNRDAVHEEKRYGMSLDQVVEIGTPINI